MGGGGGKGGEEGSDRRELEGVMSYELLISNQRCDMPGEVGGKRDAAIYSEGKSMAGNIRDRMVQGEKGGGGGSGRGG